MAAARASWRVAALQMRSTEDVDANISTAEKLIRRAASGGADLVALPENFAYLRSEGTRIAWRVPVASEFVDRFRELAAELKIHLLLGSFPERIGRRRKVHNTSLLIDPRGRILARYRKLHLFDVAIPGKAEFLESKTVAPGDRPVVVDTELGRLGLSICYDLRFPELYRRMAVAGAEVLFVPSAFTAYTGRFHWLALLRARAIENLCWVVAPAQWGRHSQPRASHGETAVIDPWGKVVACRKKGVGITTATIDLGRIRDVRRGLPALDHVRRDLFRPLPPRRR